MSAASKTSFSNSPVGRICRRPSRSKGRGGEGESGRGGEGKTMVTVMFFSPSPSLPLSPSLLPAAPAMVNTVRSPVSMTVPVVSVAVVVAPVPIRVPVIAIVPGAHHDRGGIDNCRRWWGDDDWHRQWHPNSDMDPGVRQERQGETCQAQ